MPVIVTVDLPDLAEAVGVLGLASTPPTLDSAAWRKLPPPAAALRLLDELGGAAGQDQALVVVHPPSRMDLQLVLQSLAAVIGRQRVVDVPLGRTPLAAAVAATFADVLIGEGEVPLGLVPELLRTVERQLSIAALMSGVGHLETPQPRLRQQVAGYWPTTRAVVRRGRSDRVRVVGRARSASALGRALAPADHRLVVSVPSSAPRWMREVVSSRHDGSPTPVAVLTDEARTGAHWGTERLVEAVGLAPRWRAVVRTTIERLSERTCSWCAQRVNHVDACDLCSDSSLVAAARPVGRPGTWPVRSAPPASPPPATSAGGGGVSGRVVHGVAHGRETPDRRRQRRRRGRRRSRVGGRAVEGGPDGGTEDVVARGGVEEHVEGTVADAVRVVRRGDRVRVPEADQEEALAQERRAGVLGLGEHVDHHVDHHQDPVQEGRAHDDSVQDRVDVGVHRDRARRQERVRGGERLRGRGVVRVVDRREGHRPRRERGGRRLTTGRTVRARRGEQPHVSPPPQMAGTSTQIRVSSLRRAGSSRSLPAMKPTAAS